MKTYTITIIASILLISIVTFFMIKNKNQESRINELLHENSILQNRSNNPSLLINNSTHNVTISIDSIKSK